MRRFRPLPPGVTNLQALLSLERLDGGVMVILVDLFVDSGSDLFMLVRADMLLSHGLPDILVDGRGMLSIPGDELGNGVLCFLHIEGIVNES